MRVNKEIRSERVRVVLEDGTQLGVLHFREALKEAEKLGLDLVEVAPNASPPVCKIINYGKFRYQQAKKEKEGKKVQHQVKVKEVKIKPNININDLNTKIKRAHDFLTKGYKVRATCTFRGREMLHQELGEKLLQKMFEQLKDLAFIEAPLKRMGKIMTLVFAPHAKRK